MTKLRRSSKNPVIMPNSEHVWESRATFNPGAIEENGTIHMLYRAVAPDKTSSLGYATFDGGLAMKTRLPYPVIKGQGEWETYGCEDPRITKLDSRFYILYTAFSSRGTRIAMASTQDFKTFVKHGIVGPDFDDKDAAFFPERVNGQIAMLHRIKPNIQIAYFESFEQLTNSRDLWGLHMKSLADHVIMRPEQPWESKKIGAGTPPLKTAEGWLMLYHGVDQNHVYRVGAALLDLEDPSRVVARTSDPILSPERDFEKYGDVPNVVFPQGLIQISDTLHVFYGAGDRVCCHAEVALKELLDSLVEN